MDTLILPYGTETDVSFTSPSLVYNPSESQSKPILISRTGGDASWFKLAGGDTAMLSGNVKMIQEVEIDLKLAVMENVTRIGDNALNLTTKTDINGLPVMVNMAGSLREALGLIPSVNDNGFSNEAGKLYVMNDTTRSIDTFSIAANNIVTFRYIDKAGTELTGDLTTLDPTKYSNNGALTDLSQSSCASFVKVYVSDTGDFRVLHGSQEYTSIDTASIRYTHEYVPNIAGFTLIGGLLIRKDCIVLNSTRARLVYASKWGEIIR